MTGIANSIVDQHYIYNDFARFSGSFSESEAWLWVASNSNSFVISIMYHMGIDPATHMPTNLGVTPGDNTLLDIAGGHTLSTGSWFSDIFAGDGADVVNGNGGQNYLFGGSGQDIINGGGGDDMLSGGANADTLNGNDGDDILFGNDAGADVLRGGMGYDQLFGSSGGDRFDFDALAESGASDSPADRIYEFEAGVDHIDLSTIDANPDVAGNQAFAFIGQSAFSAVGQVRFVHSSTQSLTFVYVNGIGAGGADMYIRIAGTFDLISSDFIL